MVHLLKLIMLEQFNFQKILSFLMYYTPQEKVKLSTEFYRRNFIRR